MRFALVNGLKTPASPMLSGHCPTCTSNVIPRCGAIKEWHWAHASDADCDPWSESETEWHYSWKNEFPKENQEVTVGCHRADVKLPTLVIELQNSPISTFEIEEREDFYQDMVWLVNAEPFHDHFDLRRAYSPTESSFRWKWPRRSWQAAKKPIVLDLSHSLFLLKKIYWNSRVGGYGKIIPAKTFIQDPTVLLRETITHG